MRRLVFCFDGSWNGLAAGKKPTNVLLVAESVLPVAGTTTQICYYDEGVGTASDEVWRGGGFGKGLRINLRDAYRFLIFNYQPGDEIFIFGFSRGAFTALAFLGFVRSMLILPTADASKIDEALNMYQDNASWDGIDSEAVRRMRAKLSPTMCVDDADRDWRRQNVNDWCEDGVHNLSIKYVGVWDTVGSLGWKVLASTFDRSTDKRYSRYFTEMSAMVESGRHAVSIDERRVHFMPTLWHDLDKLNAADSTQNDPEARRYQQKWFPGDHGSIGGGGEVQGLSNGPLQWILEGAVKKGLKVNLAGRSQLTKIRYDVRTPLSNTPTKGLLKKAVNRLKGLLLSADRGKPLSIDDLGNPAIRRWLADDATLPETKSYRPAILLHLADEIEARRGDFTSMEYKFEDAPVWHDVKPGEDLGDIAKTFFGDSARYREIYEANRGLLDSPHVVFPGDRLRIPPGARAAISPDLDATNVAPPPA